MTDTFRNDDSPGVPWARWAAASVAALVWTALVLLPGPLGRPPPEWIPDSAAESTAVVPPAEHAPPDTLSGLVYYDAEQDVSWLLEAPGGDLRFRNAAVAYCEQLQVLGQGDWRLPTLDEARGLVRDCLATQTGGGCQMTTAHLDGFGGACSGCGQAADCRWPAALPGPCPVQHVLDGDADSLFGQWRLDYVTGGIERAHQDPREDAVFRGHCVRRGPWTGTSPSDITPAPQTTMEVADATL